MLLTGKQELDQARSWSLGGQNLIGRSYISLSREKAALADCAQSHGKARTAYLR